MIKSIREMRKTVKILLGISIALIGILGFSIYNQSFTGRAVEDYYTYTKAICDEENVCQDYEVVCRDGELDQMNPITGAIVDNPDDWEDPRPESERNYNGLCEISD